MTVRHLYRSKHLATILNRLGHCESYDFGLELETAMAKALDETSTLLTPHIVKGEGNVLFHSEWDNLNKILTNVHVVNSAGGIMVQEVAAGHEPTKERTSPTSARSRERNLTSDTPVSLPALHIYNRTGPTMPGSSTFTPETVGNCRMIGSSGKQPMPAFRGFISATDKTPDKKSTIDYYPPINEAITEYNTVAELLKRSAEATAEVGQKYTIVTFDLGVCMKALPLIWTFIGSRFKESNLSYCLGTPDGFLAKTNKATMLHYLLPDHTEEVPYPADAIHIQDGNVLIHALKDLPLTFGGLCLKILDQMVSKKNFVFSSDFLSEHSIKAYARKRRGVTQPHHLDGPATRIPANMKFFLQNDVNKKQLFDLLLRVWSSKETASRLDRSNMAVLIVNGVAHAFTAEDGNVSVSEIHNFRSNQVCVSLSSHTRKNTVI